MIARLLDEKNTRVLVRTSKGDVCCLQCPDSYGEDVIPVGFPYTQHQYTTNRLSSQPPKRYSYCLCAAHAPFRVEQRRESSQPSQAMQKIVIHDSVSASAVTEMVTVVKIPSRLHNAFNRLQKGLNFA